MGLIHMKVQVPRRRPDVLRRPRLLAFLARHRSEKLLLVTAPAGYGKTTLLVDYAHETEQRVCWYALEESDRDPVVFVRYLVASLRQRFPAVGSRTLPALETVGSPLGSIEEPAGGSRVGEVGETLLEEVYEQAREPFLVVLNDYQAVASAAINGLLVQLLRYWPEQGQIVIVSREVPEVGLPQLAARREVAGLGVEELRFTTEEVQAFLAQSGVVVAEREAAAVGERYGGWITGIILGMHGLTGEGMSRLRREGAEEQLFAYLAEEVLAQQEEQVQRFLLESAVLRRMSAWLCNAVLERRDAQALLSLIEGRGLFVERVGSRKGQEGREGLEQRSSDGSATGWVGSDDRELWYRYHELFRGFLWAWLQKRDPERVREVSRRAGAVLAEAGEVEEAVEYLLAGEAYEQAAIVLEEIRRRLVGGGRVATCGRWLQEMPEGLVAERPGLLLLRTHVECLLGRPEAALADAQRAEMLCREREEGALLVETLLEQCWILYWSGRFAEVIPHCHRALALLAESPAGTSVPKGAASVSLVAQTHRHLGLALYHCGEVEAAHRHFQQVLDLYHQLQDMAGMAIAHFNLAMALRALAEDSAAEYHLQEAERRWSTIGREEEVPIVLNDLAVLYEWQGRYEQALATIRRAQELLERVSYTYARGYVVGTLADIQRDLGQGVQAAASYAQAWELAERIHEAHLSFWLAQGRAENHARRGELTLAQEWLEQAQRYLLSEKQGRAWSALYLTQAVLARQRGEGAAALAAAQRAQVVLGAGEWRRAWAEATVWVMALQWQQGQAAAAVATLADLLARLDPVTAAPSLWQVFQAQEGDLLPVLQAVDEGAPWPAALHERAQWLAARLAMVARPGGAQAVEPPAPAAVGGAAESQSLATAAADVVPPARGEQPPRGAGELYRIYALGEPRVYRGEQLVTQWRSAKALEVLLYLVECRHAPRKEVILEALWPEVPYPQADVIFRSTMYRLRQALGQESVVYRQGAYVLDLTYEYDVRDFQAALVEAQQWEAAAQQTGEALAEAGRAAYRRAVALYGGDYCEPLYADWCSARRDEVRQAYLGALLRLAAVEWADGRAEESVALWQRAVRVDGCAEEAHRGLMAYYGGKGQRVQVVRQYQRCLQALEELGVPPSPETVAVYRRAIAQENLARSR